MNLPPTAKRHFLNLKKGFEGEVVFDQWLGQLPDGWIVLRDLLFEYQQTIFQIDTLLISENTIYPFEIKNYEGDFYMKDNMWFSSSRIEIKNPLHQLQRNESLLRRFLLHLDFNIPIKSYIVFVNNEFTLYQAPLNLPVVYPTQLKRFINNFKTTPSRLTEKHFSLAEQLTEKHIIHSPYSRRMDIRYDFQTLKKGIICAACNHYLTIKKGSSLVCTVCNSTESLQSAILRNVEQFTFLFPDEKITTNTIHAWCGVIASKKMIQRTLTTAYRRIGQGKYAYYVKL